MNDFVSPAVQAMDLIREIGDKVSETGEPIRQFHPESEIQMQLFEDLKNDGLIRGRIIKAFRGSTVINVNLTSKGWEQYKSENRGRPPGSYGFIAIPNGDVQDSRIFDVFICHASEDKKEVARPFAIALREAGLKVWYDEFELKIGDSLRRKIDHGLAKSRVGVVVLSPSFFGHRWPEYELDGLVSCFVSGDRILLPIWHNISKREVIEYSPALADKIARSTSTHTIEKIAAEVVDVIRNRPAI